MQKRVLAINDISCMGKCSLTVALPIISAAGHECVILPTALLSTHTAQGFGNFVAFNMTDEMKKIANHWADMDTRFDAIYTGYILSPDQADCVYDIVTRFKSEETLLMVDPVLGDSGKLYRGFTEDNISAIKKLCAIADVITPNLTEGSLLTGIKSDGVHLSKADAEKMLDGLAKICHGKIVLTGVECEENVISTITRDCETGATVFHNQPRIVGSLHGSGDIFTSVLTATYLNDADFDVAVSAADGFVHRAISESKDDPDGRWYGVNFEKLLKDITER